MGSFEKKLTRRVKLKRLNFITEFKIEFLLPFTGCRKVLRKMPERYIIVSVLQSHLSQNSVKITLLKKHRYLVIVIILLQNETQKR